MLEHMCHTLGILDPPHPTMEEKADLERRTEVTSSELFEDYQPEPFVLFVFICFIDLFVCL